MGENNSKRAKIFLLTSLNFSVVRNKQKVVLLMLVMMLPFFISDFITIKTSDRSKPGSTKSTDFRSKASA